MKNLNYPIISNKIELIDKKDNNIELKIESLHLEVALEDGMTYKVLKDFIGELNGVNSLEFLTKKYGKKSCDTIIEFLDSNYLLHDSKSEHSGFNFINKKLYNYFNKYICEQEDSLIIGELSKKDIDINILKGWTYDSYYVTKMALNSATSSIRQLHGYNSNLAPDFVQSEYNHEKFMKDSLVSLGVDVNKIDNYLPLNITRLLMVSFYNFSRNDILSFMATIFLFEGVAEEADMYLELLQHKNLPKEFIHANKLHNDINNEEGHQNVSKDFYSEIEFISDNDQKRVTKNLNFIMEIKNKIQYIVVDYYKQNSLREIDTLKVETLLDKNSIKISDDELFIIYLLNVDHIANLIEFEVKNKNLEEEVFYLSNLFVKYKEEVKKDLSFYGEGLYQYMNYLSINNKNLYIEIFNLLKQKLKENKKYGNDLNDTILNKIKSCNIDSLINNYDINIVNQLLSVDKSNI